MKILKFGGSSVGSSGNIKKVLNIVKKNNIDQDKLVVVVSAFKGITDALINLTKKSQADRKSLLNSVKVKHYEIIYGLFNNRNKDGIIRMTDRLLQDLTNTLHSNLSKMETGCEYSDSISSFGERFSAMIINEFFNQEGIESEYLDTRELIKTDEQFMNAEVLPKITNRNIKGYFSKKNKIQVATGFIASTLDGRTTTLGRGGSDYTASIFGTALKAESIEIWTDVNGIMTKDPNKSKDAKIIKHLSFKKAIEMAINGAKVIYAPTLELAEKYQTPVYIRNTFNPSFEGTLIN